MRIKEDLGFIMEARVVYAPSWGPTGGTWPASWGNLCVLTCKQDGFTFTEPLDMWRPDPHECLLEERVCLALSIVQQNNISTEWYLKTGLISISFIKNRD